MLNMSTSFRDVNGFLVYPVHQSLGPIIASDDVSAQSVTRQRSVLVIEDDHLILKALEQILIKRGFQVWIASNGQEGVQVFQSFAEHIDILISDVQMPGLDGPEAIKEICKIDPSVRFCFMTADARQTTHGKLLDIGAMRVFPKPFSSLSNVAEELWNLAVTPKAVTRPNRRIDFSSLENVPIPPSLSSNAVGSAEESDIGSFISRLIMYVRSVM